MKIQVYHKNWTFFFNVKFLWNGVFFAALINSEYELLTPIYDNVSGTSKRKLSHSGHQIFNVFSNIANCFWKGVYVIVVDLFLNKKTNVFITENTFLGQYI